jgi:hypothetical protein
MKKKIIQFSVLSSSIGLATFFILLSIGACKVNFMGNKIQLNTDEKTQTDNALKNVITVYSKNGKTIVKDTITGTFFTNKREERRTAFPSSKMRGIFEKIVINDTIYYERSRHSSGLEEILLSDFEFFDKEEKDLHKELDTIKVDLTTEYLPGGRIFKKNPKTSETYYNKTAQRFYISSSKSIILFEEVIINDTIYYKRK